MKKIAFITLLLVVTFALNAYVIVRQDGTGHFTNLQDAVNSITGTETILLVGSATPYTGVNNRNISWNGNSKHISIKGMSNPVIDCQNSGNAFTIYFGNENDVVEGVVIQNANGGFPGGAIRSKYGYINVKDNTFTNCSNGNYWGEYEMNSNYIYSRGGAIFIEHPNSGMTSEITGNTFENCVAFEGGAVCIEDGYAIIENNTFNNNHACVYDDGNCMGANGEGGAIYLLSADALIKSNTFTGNSSPHLGAAVSGSIMNGVVERNIFDSNYSTVVHTLYATPATVNYIDVVSKNIFRNHSNNNNDFTLIGEVNSCINNTFINNDVYASDSALNIEFTNCIFTDNAQNSNSILWDQTLNNCLVNNSGVIGVSVTMNDCITNSDPLLDSNYIPRWEANAKSPCIDAGISTLLDSDGTISDIGAKVAVTHRQDSWTIWDASSSTSTIKWQSFPALDDVYTVNDPDMAANMLYDLLQNQIINEVHYNNGDELIEYSSQYGWQNTSHVFTSPMGYKFQTWPQTYDVNIEVSGFKESDTKSISIQQGENWIGYFLDDPQSWDEAFDGYLDDISRIATQYWTLIKINGTWLCPSKVSDLQYGDMVIVTAEKDFTMNWATGGTGDDTKMKTAESFTWQEEFDYVPIFVELNERDIPEEIGVMLNGECQGASVVEGNLVQICAYITEEPEEEISLEFHYPDRSENRIISELYTYNEISQKFVSKTSISGEADYYYFSVRGEDEVNPLPEKASIRNYPNPFNPTTTINYSLPVSGIVNIDIFNVKGQKVKQLVSGSKEAGTHTQTWNGLDDKGNPVGSGIYFYQLKTEDTSLKGKMMLLK